jgi:hypothetical protein
MSDDVPITVSGTPLPFERQPGEGSERWEAFELYRDMGAERSVRAVARSLDKSDTLIGRWSSEDQWVSRVFAFDAWLAEQRREALRTEQAERAKQHSQALDHAISVLARPAQVLASKIEDGTLFADANVTDPTKDDYVNPMHLLSLVKDTAKVLPALITASRLVNGMSTENVALEGSLTHAKGKTPAEVEAFLEAVDDGTPQQLLEGGEDDAEPSEDAVDAA